MLDERVARLYADLDGGFSHAAWLLPSWLPLPSFRSVCAPHPGAAPTVTLTPPPPFQEER